MVTRMVQCVINQTKSKYDIKNMHTSQIVELKAVTKVSLHFIIKFDQCFTYDQCIYFAQE